MIFVTVGNATQGFSRLLEAVESLARKGYFKNERLLFQTGCNSSFHSDSAQQVDFLTPDKFHDALCEARVVISHGGAGTLFQVLQLGRIPVVMPRQQKFGEHVDDHQVELVQALASEKRVIPVVQGDDLAGAISQALEGREALVGLKNENALKLFARAVEDLIGQP
jgi:UDP-N-acetylglucosamine transferase subunit ALG13